MLRLEIFFFILILGNNVLFATSTFADNVSTFIGTVPLAGKVEAVELLPRLEVASVEIEGSDGSHMVEKGIQSKVMLVLKNVGTAEAKGLGVRLKPSSNYVVDDEQKKWWKPWSWWPNDGKYVKVSDVDAMAQITLAVGEIQKIAFFIEFEKMNSFDGWVSIEIELTTDNPLTRNKINVKLACKDDFPPQVIKRDSSISSGMISKVSQTTVKAIMGLGNLFGQAKTFFVGGQSSAEDVSSLPVCNIENSYKRHAVVIGIEKYRQMLPNADFAVNDAKLVARYLINVLGYPQENVIVLLNENAARNDMEKYFGTWLKNKVESGGTVFIYYSGHGAPNPKTGDAYLVPFDGDPSFITDTGYSLQTLYNNLARLPVKKVVVALDSCFSGAGGKSVLAKGARPLVVTMNSAHLPAKNIAVLAAASANQISSTYEEKGHGLFTYFLLMGIKDALENNTNNKLEIDKMFDYLKPQVENISRKFYNNEQTPQLLLGDKALEKMGLN